MQMTPGPNTGQVTVVLDGMLTTEHSSTFRQMIRDGLNRSPRELIVDCMALSYIDSTGLGLLTLARTEASRLGCSVHLSNVNNNHTRKVFELMRFDQLFKLTYVE